MRSTRVPIAELFRPDEVALPVAGDRPVFRLGRPLADQHLVGDELLPPPDGAGPGNPQRSAGAPGTTTPAPVDC